MRRNIDYVFSGRFGVFSQQLSFVEQLELIGVFLRSLPETMGQQAAQPFLKVLDVILLADHLFAESLHALLRGVELLLTAINELLFAIQVLALLFDCALLLLQQPLQCRGIVGESGGPPIHGHRSIAGLNGDVSVYREANRCRLNAVCKE